MRSACALPQIGFQRERLRPRFFSGNRRRGQSAAECRANFESTNRYLNGLTRRFPFFWIIVNLRAWARSVVPAGGKILQAYAQRKVKRHR